MKVKYNYNITWGIVLVILLGFFKWSYAEKFMVTNTEDLGEGSLRWAITESNIHAGPDTILFNISDQDTNFNGTVWIIRPRTIYPALYDGWTYIDGGSQEINQGDQNPEGPDIMIDGRDVTEVCIGFIISSQNNIISGLIISGFKEFGIRIRENSAVNNQIYGNYIGTNAFGTDTLGNLHGIYISREASYNTIGGEESMKRNVISGNYMDGVRMTLTHHNTVIGNYIGTDKTGVFSVPNGRDGKSSGIYIGYYSNSNTVGGLKSSQRNIISGNGRDGIQIAISDSNRVQGNFIGPDVTGVVNLGNSQSGLGDCLDIRYGSKWNIIGGTSIGERNVLCGAVNDGIRIFVDSTHSNLIIGNYIGTDSSGTLNFGNGDYGIHIYEGSWGNMIGSAEENGGNIIVGSSRDGICIEDSGSTGNQMIGNRIGVDSSGESGIPNQSHGVMIRRGAQQNQIGPDNQIWYNEGFGVQLADSTVQRITITQNSIATNAGGGIQLLDGANERVEAPIILDEEPLTGTAEPNGIVEIYSDSENQGMIFEGTASVDGDGHWIYSEICTGPHITAMATDPIGNSSEFSEILVVSVPDHKNDHSPSEFQLSQNYPNPFNPKTTIKFTMINSGHVILAVYNVQGHLVEKLVDEYKEAGRYHTDFDASPYPSGVYIYKLITGDFKVQKKMAYMK